MSTADDHLDLDAVAALDAGLDDEPARDAHVRGCVECSHRLAQVRSARALLAALPDEPMPDDVAARLHAALPQEPSRATIVPSGKRRRRWSQTPALAGLAAAAAAIALVAAVAIGATRSSNHGASQAGAGSGAVPRGVQTLGNFPILTSGSHYTDASAASLVAALDEVAHQPAAAGGSSSPNSAGRAASKDTLTLSSLGPVPVALRPLYDNRQELLSCARLLAGASTPVAPLAVDFARFTGGLRHVHNAPALVVLLPHASGSNDGAFIVGPRCTSDPSQDIYAFQAVLR
jgi:hypothetical protein